MTSPQGFTHGANDTLEKRAIFSESAERAVLGAILVDRHYADDVRDLLRPEDFYLLRHKYILEAVYGLRDHDHIVDLITVNQELKRMGKFDDAGGSNYLAELLGAAINISGVKAHAQVVADYALRRRIGEMAARLMRDIENPKIATEDLRDRVESGARDLAAGTIEDEPLDMVKGVGSYFDRVEATAGLPGGVAGLATGFVDYDEKTDGLRGLMILAGRPGMGKSALAANIALNVAKTRPVYFLSMEMDADEIYARFFAIVGDIGTTAQRRGLRPGGMSAPQWSRFVKVTGELSKYPIFLDAKGTVKLPWLRRRVERLMRKQPDLGLVVVDYLQLMVSEGKNSNRQEEVSRIARGLKNLSMDTGVPVLALSQLNRAPEMRANKRPTPADLRESGELEQAADGVTFIYRDIVYYPDTLFPNSAELIIAKQRAGATGTVTLHFDASRTLFRNAVKGEIDLNRFGSANGWSGGSDDNQRGTHSFIARSTGALEDADS